MDDKTKKVIWMEDKVFNDMLRVKRMRAKTKSELEGIPRGNLNQNMLRQAYSALRMHNLGRKVITPLSKEATLIKATQLIQKEDPTFSPEFDKKIFNTNKLKKIAKEEKVIL